VELDSLGVILQCRGEVVVLEGFVAFVLELGSFLLRVPHVFGMAMRVRDTSWGLRARSNDCGKRDGYLHLLKR
jgi:hypothetical protein